MCSTNKQIDKIISLYIRYLIIQQYIIIPSISIFMEYMYF